VAETDKRRLRDKAILLPIEKFRNVAPGVMQVSPVDALDAWDSTPHTQELAAVLRGIAAEIMDYADAVEQADRQRRS
jgi:hypothetical protein